jgi:hypothetical protein
MPHRERTPSTLEYYYRDDSPRGGTGRLMSEVKRRKARKKRKKK